MTDIEMAHTPDPERDPRLADALRAADAAVLDGVSDARLELLRARIVARARPALQALRRGDRLWWEWTAGWAKLAIPLGVAAGVAALLLLANGAAPSAREEFATRAAASSVMLGAAASATPTPQVFDELVGPASHDWLLAQTVQR